MLAMCAMAVLIYTVVIRAALRGRTLPPVRVPVDAPALEYRLWRAELLVQTGRRGGVLLTGRAGDPEAAAVCRLFGRRRPWVGRRRLQIRAGCIILRQAAHSGPVWSGSERYGTAAGPGA